MAGGDRFVGSIADLMRQRGAAARDLAREQSQVAQRSAQNQTSLALQRGDVAARGQIAKGQIYANMGQQVGATLGDYFRQRNEAPEREARANLLDKQGELVTRQIGQLDRAIAAQDATETARGVAEMAKLARESQSPEIARVLFERIAKDEPQMSEPLAAILADPEKLWPTLDVFIQQHPDAKAPESFTLGPGQTRFGPNGEPLANVPKPPPAPEAFTLSPGQRRMGPGGDVIAEAPATAPNPSEASLAAAAAGGDPQAQEALRLLKEQKGAAAERSGYFTQTPLYDAQGRPVGVAKMNARTGEIEIVRPEDLGGAVTARPPGNLGQRTVENEAALDSLDRLKSMYDGGAKADIGPAEGRIRGAVQAMPGGVAAMRRFGMTPERFAEFEAGTRAFQNAMIKAITGAQMSEPEAKRIMGQIPATTDAPEVWQAKWEQSVENLQDLERRTRTDRGSAEAPAQADPLGIR